MSRKTLVCLLAIIASVASTAPRAEEHIVAPSVPAGLEVLGPYKPFLKAHAIGTQNYICAPAATPSGLDWLFIGPQATLFDEDVEQRLTHFQSKNPDKADAIQATWQHSRDSSAVWATKHSGSTDPLYVAPNAIEWLLLDVTGDQYGPMGGDKLTRTAFIQRVNTVGGVKPPSAECTPSTLNTRRLVNYEADYYFYR
jgi:Protein of unknown function (DUF3455)